MQAVVLAAGKGRRLWPLTENRPKPMIPVANRPLLEHIVETLAAAGVEEVVLVVGSNRERVQSYFEEGTNWDIDISYVVQESQLGTGHALLQAESQVGESFIALNGDRIIDPSLIEDVWARHQETSDPVVSVTRVENPSQYGVVNLDGQTITDIEEQPHPELVASKFINAGVYAFDPSIFAAIRQTDSPGEEALTDTLSEHLDSQQLHAVRYRGRWLDVSEPWDLLSVNDALIRNGASTNADTASIDVSATVADAAILADGVAVHPQATVLGSVTLGANASVGAGAIVKNSILLPDVTIKPGAVVTDCIVGANTTIGANTTVEGGAADVVLDDTVHRGVQFGGLVGDNATIGADVTVEAGTLVGNDTTVETATVVSGRIDDDSHVVRG